MYFFCMLGRYTDILTEKMKLNFETKKHEVHVQLSPEGEDETESS